MWVAESQLAAIADLAVLLNLIAVKDVWVVGALETSGSKVFVHLETRGDEIVIAIAVEIMEEEHLRGQLHRAIIEGTKAVIVDHDEPIVDEDVEVAIVCEQWEWGGRPLAGY